MALHFAVNDSGLREHHKHIYDRIGRWILAAAIIVGWVLGSATEIGKTTIAVALGAGIYTALLLAL
jgi:uncharacterized membrane protein